MPDIVIDDRDDGFVYIGNGWKTDETEQRNATMEGYENSTYHTTCAHGDSVTLKWQGTGVILYHQAKNHKGFYSVMLDTNDTSKKIYYDGYSPEPIVPAIMFNATNLNFGEHTMVLTNEKAYSNERVGCNGIDFASLIGVPESATATWSTLPTPVTVAMTNLTTTINSPTLGAPPLTTATAPSSSSAAGSPQPTGPQIDATFLTAPPGVSFQTESRTQIGGEAATLQSTGTPRVTDTGTSVAPIVQNDAGSGGFPTCQPGLGMAGSAALVICFMRLIGF